jgi:Protein of unknown function (DUF3486)
MPPRSKVEQLPADTKAWLDSALAENNFSEYDALSSYLKERGFDISKSSLHRYGQVFEERLKTLRMVTEQARAVVQSAPDDDGAVNDALVRLTQEKMFVILMEMNVDPDAVDLPKLAKAVAELGKASVAQKRWAIEARKQALAEAATEAGVAAKSAGLTDEAAEEIKRRILGIKQS